MNYIECPNESLFEQQKLFLAGGVTNCRDWQKEVILNMSDLDIAIYNPRRKDFDVASRTMEREQIIWEFKMLSKADVISFYFCKETQCPIALYELGRAVALEKKVIVAMDEDYLRCRDVEIQMSLANPEIKVIYGLENLVKAIRKRFRTCRHG